MRELIISNETPDAAKADIRRLEIRAKYKQMIITGLPPIPTAKAKAAGASFEEMALVRDKEVIRALISAEYSYKTIRSVFLNDWLLGSQEVKKKGESALKKLYEEVLEPFKLRKLVEISQQQREIELILEAPLRELSRREKIKRVNNYIVADLLLESEKHKSYGYGFYDEDKQTYYFFDKQEKMLMSVTSDEFKFFIRDRYGVIEKEYREVREAIRTQISKSRNKVRAHIFSYFDDKNYTLYINDHANGIYRIDEKGIKHLDNGSESIFFEFNLENTPFLIDIENLKGNIYFRTKISKKTIKVLKQYGISLKSKTVPGLNWDKFMYKKSYLRRFLIDRANFLEEENGLKIDEQKILLLVYFYSLFFESIFDEKLALCFYGKKESGKSFIAESIGKILFGSRFKCSTLPDDLKDLRVILSGNYYLAFDNVDHYVSRRLINELCSALTGVVDRKRRLYTDREEVRLNYHNFMAVTTREAKFRHDDFVTRLLIFKTKKIGDARRSRHNLHEELYQNRNRILTEVLLNLKYIIQALSRLRDYSPYVPERIADWGLFGMKIVPRDIWSLWFRQILGRMKEVKEEFVLEDDPMFILLNVIVNEENRSFEEVTAADIHHELLDKAETLKMNDYRRRYSSPISLAKRINNVEDELKRYFDFESYRLLKNISHYTIKSKNQHEPGEDEEE